MDPYDFAVAKVREAGAMILRAKGEASYTSDMKDNNPRNPVTNVDLLASAFLESEIKRTFPGHVIYSEENPAHTAGELLWAIDPIDGTANFMRDIPHYSVCLALIERGVPKAGAVYNPVTEELFSFKKDGGAYLNGKSIRVSNLPLSQATVFMNAGRNPEHWDWGGQTYRHLLERTLKVRNYAGSALDICFVAAGRIEAVLYSGLETLDVAAALGVLTEAGGLAYCGGVPAVLDVGAKRFLAANSETTMKELLEIAS